MTIKELKAKLAEPAWTDINQTREEVRIGGEVPVVDLICAHPLPAAFQVQRRVMQEENTVRFFSQLSNETVNMFVYLSAAVPEAFLQKEVREGGALGVGGLGLL